MTLASMFAVANPNTYAELGNLGWWVPFAAVAVVMIFRATLLWLDRRYPPKTRK